MFRPEPVDPAAAKPVHRSVPAVRAADRLVRGETLAVTDLYGTGVAILEALDARLRPPAPSASFDDRRAFRQRRATIANRLLCPVRNHRVDLKNAGAIGFLAELYPETPDLTLPFPAIQRMYGAWQRYEEGVHLAVLGHRVHPYVGTYAPTRTSHLELFATWLSQYAGPKNLAVDVGTGCGVLALMLCRAGFEQVVATDRNPNAVESVRRELARLDPSPPITLYEGDLLDSEGPPVPLVVFNPPWIPGEAEDLLGTALFHDPTLLERFFDRALERLAPDGRIVLVYSTIGQLVRPDLPHPIEQELTRGRLQLAQKLRRKVKASPGPDGRRRRTQERVEIWELQRADTD